MSVILVSEWVIDGRMNSEVWVYMTAQNYAYLKQIRAGQANKKYFRRCLASGSRRRVVAGKGKRWIKKTHLHCSTMYRFTFVIP